MMGMHGGDVGKSWSKAGSIRVNLDEAGKPRFFLDIGDAAKNMLLFPISLVYAEKAFGGSDSPDLIIDWLANVAGYLLADKEDEKDEIASRTITLFGIPIKKGKPRTLKADQKAA